MNPSDNAALEQLLGHAPICADLNAIREVFEDRTVLVTGAAGSIGSYVCKRLAILAFSNIVGLDHNESQLQHLRSQLSPYISAGRAAFHIADILDHETCREIFQQSRPDIVFHVAAHKHVVPMETNVRSAVRNNVFGTQAVLRAAEESAAQKLIFVSSDKAVRPTSIVGVTKRIGELILGAWPSSGRIRCVSARFGNVLGSSGSVLPIWQEQLKRGEPLTVTDAKAERFFILPSDAVTLLFHAAYLGQHGDIFVFNMNQPVRILDLAKAFLRQNSSASQDHTIVFTRLGPGEKLKEHLFYEDEIVAATSHPGIKRTGSVRKDTTLFDQLHDLESLLVDGSETQIKAQLEAIVPEYSFAEDAQPDVRPR